MNKEHFFPGIAHAWGDAWLSFDGHNKVKAVSLKLEIKTTEIQQKKDEKTEPPTSKETTVTNSCNDCDSVSTQTPLKGPGYLLGMDFRFYATAVYRTPSGKDITTKHAASI